MSGLLSFALVPLCVIRPRRPAPEVVDDVALAGAEGLPATARLAIEVIRRQTRLAFRTRSFRLLAGGFMRCGFSNDC